jgi:acyl phosphate:glycerol-3-phosphate acyltransferase
MEYAAACIIGYLLGSVPVALLVARRHGVDLRATADGNPGAWNALQQLGLRRAWPAFAGDGLKGTLAALTGLALGGVWVGYAALAAAMVGHAFPLFAHLRGGKSVMTFAGGMPVLAPLAAAVAIVAGLAVLIARRDAAWAIRAAVFGLPLAQLLVDPVMHVAATGACMTLIGLRFLTGAGGALSRPRELREQPRQG